MRQFGTVLIALAFPAFLSLFYCSCKSDPCKSVVCANGGVCNGGTCSCAAGYYSHNCDSSYRDKYLGTWAVTETGSITGLQQYVVTVSKGAEDNEVLIGNFYNFFDPGINATVSGDTLYILTQKNLGKLVQGQGYLAADSTHAVNGFMLVRYEVIDSATQITNDFGYNPATDSSNASQWTKE